MMSNLLTTNKLALFGRINTITEAQELEVLTLLETTYKNESIGYPDTAPDFDKQAASWSSKILFYAAQLVMYRQHSGEQLSSFFPPYSLPKTAAAILTADISLRYLPGILKYLEQIDLEDALIPIIKELLNKWHYSGLISDMDLEVLDIQTTLTNPCLATLYVDRIIEYKRKNMGQKKEIKPMVLAALGNFENEFWKDFNVEI